MHGRIADTVLMEQWRAIELFCGVVLSRLNLCTPRRECAGFEGLAGFLSALILSGVLLPFGPVSSKKKIDVPFTNCGEPLRYTQLSILWECLWNHDRAMLAPG